MGRIVYGLACVALVLFAPLSVGAQELSDIREIEEPIALRYRAAPPLRTRITSRASQGANQKYEEYDIHIYAATEGVGVKITLSLEQIKAGGKVTQLREPLAMFIYTVDEYGSISDSEIALAREFQESADPQQVDKLKQQLIAMLDHSQFVFHQRRAKAGDLLWGTPKSVDALLDIIRHDGGQAEIAEEFGGRASYLAEYRGRTIVVADLQGRAATRMGNVTSSMTMSGRLGFDLRSGFPIWGTSRLYVEQNNSLPVEIIVTHSLR